MVFLESCDNNICFKLFSFVTFLWYSGLDFSFIMFTEEKSACRKFLSAATPLPLYESNNNKEQQKTNWQ